MSSEPETAPGEPSPSEEATPRKAEPEPRGRFRSRVGKTPAGVGYWPMYAIGLVFMIDQFDQNVLRGVLVQIQEELLLSDFELGMLTSAFVFVHAVIIVPAGYIADRWNRKKTIGWTIVLWSAITSLSGACRNFLQLFLVRAALGMGQAMTEPAANSLLADYYPVTHRGRAYSIMQVFFFVGTGAGLALGGVIGAALGWRWAFILAGIPGLLIAYLALRLREPRRGFGDRVGAGIATSFESEDLESKRSLFEHGVGYFLKSMLRGLWDDLKTIAGIPTLRYALVGVSVLLFTVTGLFSWLSVFYHRFNALSPGRASVYVGAIVGVGGVAGTLVGGRVADAYMQKIEGARMAIPAYCMFASVTIFGVSFLPAFDAQVFVRLAIQLMGAFVLTMAVPSLRAGLSDAVPATLRGAGFAAFTLCSAIFGAALAPSLIGQLSSWFGSNLRTAFYIVMPPVYLGAVVLLQARGHLENDTSKILQAVVVAMQKQHDEEAQRSAGAPEGSGGRSIET